jgi:hypothetical protein
MVWPADANTPNLFWFERGSNSTNGRFTSDNATFAATCSGSDLDVRVNGEAWRVIFRSWPGYPLRRGTYDLRAPGPSGSPAGFNAFPANQTFLLCATGLHSGTFTVDELDIPASGLVRRFAARYDMRCSDGSLAIRGEMRLTNVPPAPATGSRQPCLQ